MSIIAFLSEPFSKTGNEYLSNKASINFVKSCFSEKVITVGRVVDCDILNPSSSVNIEDFEESLNYDSIVDFFKQALKNPAFVLSYIKSCFSILEKHPGQKVWVRNPSIGCLIFSLCALKENRVVYNHMCANAMNAWDSPKYKGLVRVMAFIFSFILKKMVKTVVSHNNTINLCTGDELLEYCIKLNSKSYLLIDSNIKKITFDSVDADIDEFKFLFVGRIQEDKGILELLESFKKIKNTKFKLDIIGDGPLLNELENKYTDKRINFLGQIKNSELSDYFLRSHVLVVPSKNRYEGFPRVILEAWSNGLPVIVSNVGGVKSFVVDGDNGYLVDLKKPNDLENAMVNVSNYSNFINMKENCRYMSKITTESYWVSKFKEIDVRQ
ncbi:glycosyltransferase [Vibrio splendidus]|uniref:glycosyltransferase n=1 Tax=Vibrio splendidus TaxID=29497 RepID=UPI000C86048D|nr:glycosyltransferase [Vibrio splendidus]PMH70887.1 hypothetical protein BCU61_06155 [Vibrio splendidus]